MLEKPSQRVKPTRTFNLGNYFNSNFLIQKFLSPVVTSLSLKVNILNSTFSELPFARLVFTGIRDQSEPGQVISYSYLSEFAPVIKQSLLFPRHYHVSIYARGFLYILGGVSESVSEFKKCKRFSVDTEEWQEIADLPMPVDLCASAFKEDSMKLYLIGGESSAFNYKQLNLIHEFDLLTLTWRTIEVLFPPKSDLPIAFSINHEVHVLINSCIYQLDLDTPSFNFVKETSHLQQAWTFAVYENDMLHFSSTHGANDIAMFS